MRFTDKCQSNKLNFKDKTGTKPFTLESPWILNAADLLTMFLDQYKAGSPLSIHLDFTLI